MKLLNRPCLSLLSTILLLSASVASASTVRYDYFPASTYNVISTDAGFPAANPFNTTHAVSGYFEVDTMLAPNTDYDFYVDGEPAGLTYSFTDGVNTTQAISYDYFNISTDAQGNISQWFISMYAGTDIVGADYTIITTANCPDACDFSIIRDEGAIASSGDFALGRVSNSPGSWQVTEVSSPVPVPAAVWLFASGLIGLVGIARKR